jgi:acyl phosphate:glycerol-3-phosphate acyltransferase
MIDVAGFDPIIWAGALIGGYVLGAIPFGVLFTKAAGLSDIRSIGSGNIGATNVLRTGRKDLAAATLFCDALKGSCAVWLAASWGQEASLCSALGAFIGHIFPLWLKFKGGKGVATFLGCLIAVAWPVAFVFIGLWLGVALITRYSSAGALSASLAVPITLFFWYDVTSSAVFGVLAIVLWVKHRDNIRRLLAGSEGKIGRS